MLPLHTRFLLSRIESRIHMRSMLTQRLTAGQAEARPLTAISALGSARPGAR